MTTSLRPESKASSRRALLAGALGGLGALAASAIGRPSLTEAHDVDDVLLGGGNTATATTSITNNSNSNTVLAATSSSSGAAFEGTTTSGDAIQGNSESGTAVRGTAGSGFGVKGVSNAVGVYGSAAGTSSSKGVWGETTVGHAIHGTATSGFAGYFAGKVYTTRFHELKEIADPTAPAADKARLFVRDNGLGKTQLCVRFNTGAIRVLATQA